MNIILHNNTPISKNVEWINLLLMNQKKKKKQQREVKYILL